jgi:hypothetical protein
MSDREIDYPEDYEFKEEDTFVIGGQMWEQANFQNVELDLELTTRAGEMITDPTDRFKVEVRQIINDMVDISEQMRQSLREVGQDVSKHYFPTEDDKGLIIQSMRKVGFLALKNPRLYVLGYIQARQGTEPLSELWFADEPIDRVNLFMYARYWLSILF